VLVVTSPHVIITASGAQCYTHFDTLSIPPLKWIQSCDASTLAMTGAWSNLGCAGSSSGLEKPTAPLLKAAVDNINNTHG